MPQNKTTRSGAVFILYSSTVKRDEAEASTALACWWRAWRFARRRSREQKRAKATPQGTFAKKRKIKKRRYTQQRTQDAALAQPPLLPGRKTRQSRDMVAGLVSPPAGMCEQRTAP